MLIRVIKESEGKKVSLCQTEDGKKYIHKEFIGSHDIYEMLSSFHDAALPEIYSVKEEAESVMVEMEYIDGMNLTEVLSEGILSEKQSYRIMQELCRATDILHKNDIVHRDIKPDNIMITKENRVVLVDFDSARRFKLYQSEDTRYLGTPGYAAPEQYGVCQTDDKADIYALGILLNLLLTGEHPSRKLYDGKWRKVIERCTNINPEKRFATAKELLQTLDGRRRKGKGLAIIILFLLLSGILIGGYRLFPRQKENTESEQQTASSRYQQYIGCWGNSEYASAQKTGDNVEDYFKLWVYHCDSETIVFDMLQYEGTANESAYGCVGQKKSENIYEFTYYTARGMGVGRGTLRLQNEKLYLNMYQTEQGEGTEPDVCNMKYDGYLIRVDSTDKSERRDLSEVLGVSRDEAESYLSITPGSKEGGLEYIRYFCEDYIIDINLTTEKVQRIQCFFQTTDGDFRSSNEVQGVDFTKQYSDFTKKFGEPYSKEELAKGQQMVKYAVKTKNGDYWMYVTFSLQGVAQEVYLEEQEDV